jgi:succinate dehydrogenase/fumarate reductase flavoprotein subunit
MVVSHRLLRHLRDVLVHGRSMDLANGNALIGRLAKEAFARGVSIRTSAPVKDLIKENGSVTGVRYQTAEGTLSTLRARKGVVLACGGFPHDIERRKEVYAHAPTGTEHRSPTPAGNTGDGIRMAECVGAVFNTNLSDAAAWAPVSLVPQRSGKPIAFPHLIDRQKPGFIAVTRHGKRFVNESESYHDFVRGLIKACAGEPEPSAFLIGDHRAVRQYGMGFAKPTPVPVFGYVNSGYLIRGATLEDLAKKMGIEAAGFVKTVEEFNKHARLGNDPEFGKGTSSYNRYNGDPLHKPNPCVAPVEVAPYYAVKIYAGDLGTFAGLKTDARARVLDAAGEAIEGLYAAGNDMSHIMEGEYMGGGTTLGPAMTFGYIAGCDLADSVGTKAP